jgi:hypothetical protein
MRAQQLEMIYSQFGMLYNILLDVSWSTIDKAKKNYGLHVKGIVGSTKRKSTNLLSIQLQQFWI